VGGATATIEDVGVDHRHADVGVREQLVDDPNVVAAPSRRRGHSASEVVPAVR
jgi:hypothetical protein